MINVAHHVMTIQTAIMLTVICSLFSVENVKKYEGCCNNECKKMSNLPHFEQKKITES